jgi:glycosyltransferase involved in cell wall biosynthesis
VAKLKVLLTSGIYPPDKGGPAHFVSTYSKWLAKSGVDTSVLSLTDQDSTNKEDAGVKVSLISRKHMLPIRFSLASISIAKPLAKKRVILMNGLFLETLLATVISRARLVAKVPGDIVWERARNQGLTSLTIDQYQGKERGGKKLFRLLFTKSLGKANHIIAPSLHLKQLIGSWGIDSKKISVIRNSVDTELFAPDLSVSKRFDVITVCRLVPWKGVDELINECSKRGLSLAVVGDGPERSNLEKLAQGQSGCAVTFLGDVTHTNLPALLNASKIFVLNSHYEGSPHSLIEALSIGMAAVARESTGSAEVINDSENGLLSGKSRSLGDSIDLLMKDSALIEKLQKGARATALAEYDQELNFGRIKSVLEGAL